MAEIIDGEAIKKKLKEFEEFIKQNISLLEELKKVKIDSTEAYKKILANSKQLAAIENDLKSIFEKSNEQFKEIISYKESIKTDINKLIKELSGIKIENTEFLKEGLAEIRNDNEAFREQIDKKITDFLYKQNALVDNLNQQIGSYHSLINSLKQKLEEQGNDTKALREEIGTLEASMEKKLSEINSETTTLKSKLNSLENRIQEIDNEMKKSFIKKIFG